MASKSYNIWVGESLKVTCIAFHYGTNDTTYNTAIFVVSTCALRKNAPAVGQQDGLNNGSHQTI